MWFTVTNIHVVRNPLSRNLDTRGPELQSTFPEKAMRSKKLRDNVHCMIYNIIL